MTVSEMTAQQIRSFIRKVEPHNEGGEPMVSCHYELWCRIVDLADPNCLNCGMSGSQHHDGYGDTVCGNFRPDVDLS